MIVQSFLLAAALLIIVLVESGLYVIMADSTSLHTSCWFAIDGNLSAASDLGRIMSDRNSVGPSNTEPAVYPLRRSAIDTMIVPLSRGSRCLGSFERMARDAQRASPMRSRILGLLLQAADPAHSDRNSILRTLWTYEAMHLGYQMVRLIRLLDHRIPLAAQTMMPAELEWAIAKNLAETLVSLCVTQEAETRLALMRCVTS